MPYNSHRTEVEVVTMAEGPSAGKQLLQITHFVQTGPKSNKALEPLLMIARDAESLAELLLRAVAALRGTPDKAEAGATKH